MRASRERERKNCSTSTTRKPISTRVTTGSSRKTIAQFLYTFEYILCQSTANFGYLPGFRSHKVYRPVPTFSTTPSPFSIDMQPSGVNRPRHHPLTGLCALYPSCNYLMFAGPSLVRQPYREVMCSTVAHSDGCITRVQTAPPSPLRKFLSILLCLCYL